LQGNTNNGNGGRKVMSINGVLVIAILGIWAFTAYTFIDNGLSASSVADEIKEFLSDRTKDAGELVEGAVAVACTTITRQEVGPLVSGDALVLVAENFAQLRCGDFNTCVTRTESIQTANDVWGVDWAAPDGSMQLWMSAEVSVPVSVDMNNIRIDFTGMDSIEVVYTLPQPYLGEPRIDFSNLYCSVDHVANMSNGDISTLAPPIFHQLLSECGSQAMLEAESSAILEDVRQTLRADLIQATRSIYPEASVVVNYHEDSPRPASTELALQIESKTPLEKEWPCVLEWCLTGIGVSCQKNLTGLVLR